MFFKKGKGAILIEAETERLKVCYMVKAERKHYEKIELSGDIAMESAIKEYTRRHNISPTTASILIKNPDVKVRYRKLEGTPIRMVGKAVKDIDWLNVLPSQDKMIEDYQVVNVCDGSTCVLWAAVPEKIVMGYVEALRSTGITLERVDVYHNCIAKKFCKEKDKELLVLFRHFGEAGIIYLKNGILWGIRDVMLDYDDLQTVKLFNAIDLGFSVASLGKVYILDEELHFAKEYFDERGIPCEILTKAETDFLSSLYV